MHAKKHKMGFAVFRMINKSAFKEAELRYCAVLVLFSGYGSMLCHAAGCTLFSTRTFLHRCFHQ